MASLDFVHMKLGLARERIQEIEAACDAFVQEDPNTQVGVEMKNDLDTGEFVVMARIPAEFPLRLGGLVGEALFNLRSALDNLAWQLVLANDETPDDKTEFPIFKDPGEFERRTKHMTRGMSDDAIAAIKRLQPFNEWPENPTHTTLWMLHDLNNIDKHRLPHLVGMWLAKCKGGLRHPGDSGAKLLHVAKRGPIEDGAVLVHIVWDPVKIRALGDVKVQVHFHAEMDVAISNPEAGFITDRGEPAEVMPLRHLFNVTQDHLDHAVIPSFGGEFS